MRKEFFMKNSILKYIPSIAILLIGNEILSLLALMGIMFCGFWDICKARFDR